MQTSRNKKREKLQAINLHKIHFAKISIINLHFMGYKAQVIGDGRI